MEKLLYVTANPRATEGSSSLSVGREFQLKYANSKERRGQTKRDGEERCGSVGLFNETTD